MKAAIYCRISLDRTGEGAGVTRQLEDCMKLVEMAGWTAYETYTDNDISATSGKPRPEYRRMLRAIEAGAVDAVVAWHPDRLYRKLADLEELIAAVDKNNVVLRTVRAGEFDLSTPTGKMLARILSSVATAEGEMKSDRWKRSVRQRREAGTFAPSGPRMYGWTREGEPIKAEADVIRWMAEEITKGVPTHGLARKMERLGLTTSTGKPWQVQTIRKLLANPKLAGFATLNGDIIGTGEWEPILDPEAWEVVRARVTNRKRKQPPRVALLAGLIYCGACGTRMVTGARMTKGQETQRVYRCSRVPGAGGCGKISVRADTVEEIVEAYARARLDDERVREHVRQLQQTPRTDTAEVAVLEARIQELEAQLDEPGVPVATILRAIDRARERLDVLLRDIASAAPVALPERGGEWPEDLARRVALVGVTVGRVEVHPATRSGVFDPERVTIQPR